MLVEVDRILRQPDESVDWQEPWWDDYLNRRDKIAWRGDEPANPGREGS